MKREIIDASQLELVDQVVDIKRVTKVVKGGRNMRFTALVVVGDKNGHVGAGLGKAAEIPEAIRKGKEDAIKSMVNVKLDENNSITHDVTGKYTGASVLLKKSPEGTGIIAGGPARSVCEIAGIQNIRTKSLGSNNKQNVVLATIEVRRNAKMADRVKVTLIKSTIGAVPKNKKTIEALGLTKLGKTVELPNNAATQGAVRKVAPYVKVEEV